MTNSLRQRLTFLPLILALIVVGLTVALKVVNESNHRPRAHVGEVFDYPYHESPLPRSGELVVPWARLEVSAGQAEDELPDISGAEANVRAPAGGSFVRVDVRGKGDIVFAAIAAPNEPDVDLLLRADDKDYPLFGPGGLDVGDHNFTSFDDAIWVAVEGHPKDLAVVVRIGSEEQILNASDGSVELGRAAGIANLPTYSEQIGNRNDFSCGRFRRVDDSPLQVPYPRFVGCTIQHTLHTPYVDGIGWAQPGREFLVVLLGGPTNVDVLVPGGARSYDTSLKHSAELGGTPSMADPWGPDRDASDLSDLQFVFDVAEGEPVGDLAITTRINARGQTGFTSKTERAAIQWTIPGRKLA